MCDIHSALHYVYRVVPLSDANVNNDNTPSIPPQHRRRLLINGVISLPKKSSCEVSWSGVMAICLSVDEIGWDQSAAIDRKCP